MNGLLNGRRLIATALGVALTAVTLMLAAGTSQAYGGGGYRGGYRGGHGYRASARVYVNHGGRGYGAMRYRGGAGFYRGPRVYRGGARHIHRHGYRHHYPRAYVGFGLGLAFGAPYHYYPRPYPYHVYHHHDTEKESELQPQVQPEPSPEPELDVTNEPPAGCYYYDRTCDREFKTLDDYTDHLDEFTSKDHPQTIRVVSDDTDETIRTLEFVGGYWSVKK